MDSQNNLFLAHMTCPERPMLREAQFLHVLQNMVAVEGNLKNGPNVLKFRNNIQHFSQDFGQINYTFTHNFSIGEEAILLPCA